MLGLISINNADPIFNAARFSQHPQPQSRWPRSVAVEKARRAASRARSQSHAQGSHRRSFLRRRPAPETSSHRQGHQDRGRVAQAASGRTSSTSRATPTPRSRSLENTGICTTRASTAASAATTRCSIPPPNSSPAPDGPVSGSRSPRKTSPKSATLLSAWCAPRSPAPNATLISATSSTMAPSPRIFATA